jgi:hypothetical protein
MATFQASLTRGSVVHRAAIVALVFAASAACHTIHTVDAADMQRSRPPQRVWVTLPDSSTLLVQQPEVSGDTLVGMVYGEPARVSLNDAVSIRTKQAAPARTVALALVSGGVLIGTLMYLQSRPDVHGTSMCYYSIIGSTVNPCCQGTADSLPC